MRWRKALCFNQLLQRYQKENPTDLVGRAALLALAQKQAHTYGVVMMGGHEIAAKGGIGESTWWHAALPRLEGGGYIRRAERGGGRVKGGDGRANVYCVASPEAELAEQKARAAFGRYGGLAGQVVLHPEVAGEGTQETDYWREVRRREELRGDFT